MRSYKQITIYLLQTELTSRSKTQKQTQTASSQINSTTVIVRCTRKDNSENACYDLGERKRRKTSKKANIAEGGENGDGGDIRSRVIKVSLEYNDGKTDIFWANEGERVYREREDHVFWRYI